MKYDITVIGAAILDILTGPVTPEIFSRNSTPMNSIRLSFGGDALNEAVVLSRMGKTVDLISQIGQDDAGDYLLHFLKREHISDAHIQRSAGLDTGINVVLVDELGERRFLSNPNGSLRTLSEPDILPHLDTAAQIVSFASMFVSSKLDIPAMTRIFHAIKQSGRTLAVDMTKPKHGETLDDLLPLLPYIDFFFPNHEEIALLTGEHDPKRNAKLLVGAGVSCAAVKWGSHGCIVATQDELLEIPAHPVRQVVDTTGAGDCFAAGFLWGLSEGFSLADCGKMACATASCTVEQLGATTAIFSAKEPLHRFRTM